MFRMTWKIGLCGPRRLSLKEDFENILRTRPWFIGDHFLSLRPWEPNFKLASANVSFIAVWIRLNELPIEYYNVEALHHIGRAIGNVLGVDTFITFETRGRFARKESCPYTIRQKSPTREARMEVGVGMGARSHEDCEPNSPRTNVRPNGEVHEAIQEIVHEGTYSPWVMVARRRNETKMQRSRGGSLFGQRNDRTRFSNDNLDLEAVHKFEESMEIHIPANKEECEEWVDSPNRPSLGRSNKPLVAIFGGCAFARGGTKASVGKFASDFPNAYVVQYESNEMPFGEENAREAANIHFHYGKQTIHEASTSILANGDLQSACVVSGNGDGSPSSQYGIVPKRGADKGGAQVGRMEFEGGGKVDSAF
nr:hypothetical protein CFP56_38023 [Quercus suber]